MSYQKFLEFQRAENGVLRPSDAAQFCKVSRATVYRWANRKRVATMRHRRTLYFGVESLRSWAIITRTAAAWQVVEARREGDSQGT